MTVKAIACSLLSSLTFFCLGSNLLATESPPLSGTFFMADINSTPEQTKKYIQEVSETGMNTIIILATGVLEKVNGSYKETDHLLDSNIQTGSIIKEANSKNIDLYLGLVSYDMNATPHWVGNPDDPNTDKGRLIDYSLRLIDQAKNFAETNNIPWSRIKGFYLGETGPANLATPTVNELVFWKELSTRIKQAHPSKKLLISPYVLQENSYSYLKSVYENIYRETPIDIIAPQDSMGSLKVTTFEKSAELFKALHDATVQFPGREAWANIETQLQPNYTSIDYKPSNIEMIWQQIEAAKPYVSKNITWIYQHTMLTDPSFDNIYSWTNQYTPTNAVLRKKLRADYVNAYSSTPIFTDVPPYHPNYEQINLMYNKGIFTGCKSSPLMFCPKDNLTRAQAAVILLKTKNGSNYTPPAITKTKFKDVSTGHWAANWIEQLSSEEITSGCGNDNYCPDSPLTRSQVAVFLLKIKHGNSYTPPTASGTFGDVSKSHWAANWIEQLKVEGLTTGCTTGPTPNFCPEQNITRAEAAFFLSKVFNLTNSNTSPSVQPSKSTGNSNINPDINKDGQVNLLDYNFLIAEFGKTSSLADIDKSGKVDIFDYNSIIGNYGK